MRAASHWKGLSSYPLHGKVADNQRLHLPKATSQVVARAVEKNHGVYFKLAKAFEEKDWDVVEQIAENDKKEFEKVS